MVHVTVLGAECHVLRAVLSATCQVLRAVLGAECPRYQAELKFGPPYVGPVSRSSCT